MLRRLVAKAVPALVTLSLLATTGCGTVMMKPPPAPPPSMPSVEAAPPEPTNGGARVLVTTDVPARVTLASGGTVMTRRGESAFVETGTVLCTSTPCSLTLPYGDYDLAFAGIGPRNRDRESTITISVARSTEVVNHTLGKHSASVGKTAGAVFMMIGVVALGVAIGVTEGNMSKASTGMRTLGLGGIASTAFGSTLFFASPTYHQEGSTTQWTPGPAGQTIGGGLGLRF